MAKPSQTPKSRKPGRSSKAGSGSTGSPDSVAGDKAPLTPAFVDAAGDANAPRSTRVSIWVKLFVGFQVFAITVWAIPGPRAQSTTPPHLNPIEKISRLSTDWLRNFNQVNFKEGPLKYYMEPTGFWQYWDMFAPDPAQTDIYLTAKVTYADGSSMIYHYPRMAELSIFWKYVKERYRKFYERAGSDQFQYLWPPTAQRIAFICDDRPGNPPVEVDLIRHWLQIYPPGKPQQKGYNTYTYFRYQVDPELLKETHEDN